jgi:hypothetical protein
MSQEKESTYLISPEGGQVGEVIIKFDLYLFYMLVRSVKFRRSCAT